MRIFCPLYKCVVSDAHALYPPIDINIPLFFVLWIGYKLIKRTKVWKPEEMDFVTGIPTVEETEVPEEPPRTFSEKIAAIIF